MTELDAIESAEEAGLRWFRRLAIPPAWTDVWICLIQRGHLQATGRDARGRKVYRYHPRWRAVRDEVKYEHTLAFGRALPQIRRRVDDDLAVAGCHARSCWRRSCGCSRRRASGSATPNTRERIVPLG